jgi:hypothetical protein
MIAVSIKVSLKDDYEQFNMNCSFNFKELTLFFI